jgi:hypothetical protein
MPQYMTDYTSKFCLDSIVMQKSLLLVVMARRLLQVIFASVGNVVPRLLLKRNVYS